MYCERCGKENENGVNFCGYCGAPLKRHIQVGDNARKKKTAAVATVCVAAALLLCIIGTLIFLTSRKTAEYNDKVENADKYLREIEYSKAEAAYLEAINIRPKEEKAYIKLSTLYMSQGKYDEAADVLQKGMDKMGRNASQQFEQLYDEVKNGKTSPQYQAYYELCKKRQKEYGKGYFDYNGFTDEFTYGDLRGLIFAKLFDFNNDGNFELILAYSDENAKDYTNKYAYEIWAWQDGELVNVLPKSSPNYGSDPSRWINTATKDGITYLEMYESNEDGIFDKYIKYENGKFVEDYVIEREFYLSDEGQEIGKYYINGKEVSLDDQEKFIKENRPEKIEDYDSSTLRAADAGQFTVLFSHITEEYAEKVLSETERTMKILKGSPKKETDINASNVFDDLPSFTFASGVGAWRTVVDIADDGTFEGKYTDSDMDVTGEGYPNGTTYICQFSGKFTEVKKIDDHTYSMQLESIRTEGDEGEEYISNGIKYIISDPYGMQPGKEFYLYLPGSDIDSLPEEYYLWISSPLCLDENVKSLPCYGLYNEEAGTGFFSEE